MTVAQFTTAFFLAVAAIIVVGLIKLVVHDVTQPDHVFDSLGEEIDCHHRSWDQCIAAHCLYGYDPILQKDLGAGGQTFRCKPKESK